MIRFKDRAVLCVEGALEEVAGIKPDSLLSGLVLDAYAKLQADRKALPKD